MILGPCKRPLIFYCPAYLEILVDFVYTKRYETAVGFIFEVSVTQYKLDLQGCSFFSSYRQPIICTSSGFI